MNTEELQSLDEALYYLNEGKLMKKIKDVFNKYKRKFRKASNKDKNTQSKSSSNRYEAIDPVTSKSREKFLKEVLSKSKSIANKYNSQGGIGANDLSECEDFYICSCKIDGKLFYDDDYICIIAGAWDELKCWNKPEYKNLTKSEYADTPEVKAWYDNQNKCLEECKKAFAKYGTVEWDGEYDDFMIDLHLNKETKDSFDKE